jgi:hypothetical protein
MNQHWTVTRTLIEQPDAHQRWDRAYQLIVAWTTPMGQDGGTVTAPGQSEEDAHEPRCVCAGLDPTPSSSPHD